jgi:hypothetical protein
MKHNSVAGGTVGDLFPKAQLSLPMGGFSIESTEHAKMLT